MKAALKTAFSSWLISPLNFVLFCAFAPLLACTCLYVCSPVVIQGCELGTQMCFSTDDWHSIVYILTPYISAWTAKDHRCISEGIIQNSPSSSAVYRKCMHGCAHEYVNALWNVRLSHFHNQFCLKCRTSLPQGPLATLNLSSVPSQKQVAFSTFRQQTFLRNNTDDR